MQRKPPTELTDELKQEICKNVTAGMLPRAAAVLAGVDRHDFSDWMRRAKKGQEPFVTLAHEIETATLTVQRQIVAKVSLAATKDPKIGMLFLAMRYPEDWTERGRERSVQLEVESRSADEIKALAARMASQFGSLEWESREGLESLIAGLLAEHQPEGPTEEHLVEDLAGILLRKNRLRRAETASHRSALHEAVTRYRSDIVEAAVAHLGQAKLEAKAGDALAANDDDTAEELAAEERWEGQVESIVAILESKKPTRYELALEALGDRRRWWDDALARERAQDEDDAPNYKATPEGLLSYLQDEILPWYAKNILMLKSRPLIREQAFGEAFDAEDVERLTRIEGFLDRKFEKTLDRLLRIQELRRAKAG